MIRTLPAQILAVFGIAFRRLFAQRWLALATAFGLVISIALTMSIPLYADAIHFRLLRERVADGQALGPETPLRLRFHYRGPRRNAPQWQDAQAINDYAAGAARDTLGLPALVDTRLLQTSTFNLYPPLDPNKSESKYFLDYLRFAALSDPERHIGLVSGRMPAVADATPNSVVEVLLRDTLATQYGIGPGDLYYMRRDDGLEVSVSIAGVWTPLNSLDPVWDKDAAKLLIVPEQTYVGRIAPALEDELYDCTWYIVLNGAGLHSGDVAALLERIQSVRQRMEVLLPGAGLEYSPVEALAQYQNDAPTLTLLLYAFSVPILGLTLAFIGLVTGLFVGQHQHEIAILRSRGASAVEVVGVAAVEGALLGALAMVFGIPGGQLIAHAIGRSRSFLNFTGNPGFLRVDPTLSTLGFGIAAVAVVLLVQIVVPALGAARRTIVTYKQERARSVRPPWWQRAWLDFLLLIPAGYGVYLLRQQGSLAAAGGAAAADPLQNPLLLLVPALGIFAVTLFMLRLVPLVMAVVAWLAAWTDSVGVLMAARYLSRTPAFYSAPLALLVLTLSLSAFTASLAQTLDQHLYRQLYYRNGADLNIAELGISSNAAGAAPSGPGPVTTTPRGTGPATYIFNPVDEHLSLPGVLAATRAGHYRASLLRVAGTPAVGSYLGVDRWAFPQVAFWQRDFAPASLGDLMNALAAGQNAALVSREFFAREALKLGDPLKITVNTGDGSIALDLQIVGVFDLFPTWYPETGPLVVGNLDYLYEQAGAEYPHQVWLRTAASADGERIVQAVRGFTVLLDPKADREHIVENGLNTFVDEWANTPREIAAEQRRPERQGLFGLLSVGFATSALLTVLGFLLYALFSFRRRFIELGMLRAVGLSAGQMTTLLAAELAFLVLIGIGAGTLLGVEVSRVFIPYLQVGAEAAARFPPFVVAIAWPSIFQIYLLFGLLFIAALGVLAALLLRMKIFQAVKLGETT